jgi:uncharacterized protein (TIGR03437 family)
MKSLVAVAALFALPAAAQVSDNKSLTGKYFFRHVSVLTDANGSLSETRTAWGAMTFDGNGGMSYQGSQMVGANPPVSLTGTGSYSVKPGAFATISNPLRNGTVINARVGMGAVAGSSTESGTTLFDIFVAVPAPAQAMSAASLNGPYWVTSFEMPNGSAALVRNTWFKLTANGNGDFGDAAITGEAANLGNRLMNLVIPGVTYSASSDGSGTLNLPMPPSANFSTQLIGGAKALNISPDGSFFIGGSTGNAVHGLIVGVRAFGGNGGNSSYRDLYWAAGLRYDRNTGRMASFAGAANATGSGSAIWHRRLRQTDSLIDYTLVAPYSLKADGSGLVLGEQMAVASTGQMFASTGVGIQDSNTYEICFGVRAPAQSGAGVFLNPQGILNAASFAPAGNPVSPGELVTAFGSGLAASTVNATALPFPMQLGGISVTVNGQAAPIYYVSAAQISFLIPFGATGQFATILVTNKGIKSNAVDVPLAASSPGLFTLPQTGIGAAAILHADFSTVSPSSPAKRGETIQLYLTGLGATTPLTPDGEPAPVRPLSVTTAPIAIFAGSTLKPATVLYKGLAPTLAGLYQANFTIPADAPTGTVGISVQTVEAFTDLADISIVP